MGKIAQNIMKVGVHACLSNGHPNLWSNFNCEKIVKSETTLCIFTRVQLKAGPNISKHCKISWAWSMGIQIYDQVSIIRSTSKVKLHRTVLLGFGLKELKITLNIVKVGVHTYHPNVHQKIWSNFNSEKFIKTWNFVMCFHKGWG